ncbi:tryptophan--tRNA ligase [uncultured Parasutterella sp.]|mgnify:FL=1|jgi:tryptophanyl-tRNA synthetase|uniref:tryptophan--tRNA ligase n=1 Tax=uncultured Parasutterella sp. TaxID=1263098 RepID=UPI0025D90A5A|nr:tryptophan--tRNA ligase [uncultured Parasutterella sp.]
MTVRVLTGVTPSGTLHLGNYVGAIRPAIQKSRAEGTESFYFLSDYHALIKTSDPDRVEKSRIQIAATWLACGLDPKRVHFYRQSDLPETLELNWILNCVTSKGLMNRAHAYKAKVEANEAAGEDPDNNVTMGLFCYPILMAADILIFKANFIPVGRDQIQHIEMCRDIATRFNQMYGNGEEIFPLPEALVDEDTAILPGLDGRKMSKSYDNVIPLFEGGEKALREAIMKIVTDSKLPGEPKDPDSTSLTALYDAFATHDERNEFRKKLQEGLGWGEAKEIVFQKINSEIGPMRERYEAYMQEPEKVEEILREGVERIRPMARALVDQCRNAVGLRTFKPLQEKKAAAKVKKSKASLKQYREKDGLFYFKLVNGQGKTLLTAGGLPSGKEVGAHLQSFKASGLGALKDIFCQLDAEATETEVQSALDELTQE